MNLKQDNDLSNLLEFENLMQEELDNEFIMDEEEFQSFVGNFPDFDKLQALDEGLDSFDLLMQEIMNNSQEGTLDDMMGTQASILHFAPTY